MNERVKVSEFIVYELCREKTAIMTANEGDGCGRGGEGVLTAHTQLQETGPARHFTWVVCFTSVTAYGIPVGVSVLQYLTMWTFREI